MTDVNTTYTSLKDAINICLSCIGETPVSAPTNTSTNVVLSKQIIEEVSRDVQSKGWWFNTTGTAISILSTTDGTDTDGNISFNGNIPEEARRYISIRAARVLQLRFVGSEELMKFTFQEEQVSLAILTQAHVRNNGDSTSFNSFPTELKALGVEEVMFLQQTAEEKLLSLRLKTELKQADKLASEKDLVDAQKSQVQTETVLKAQQALTELEETAKREAEASLVAEQELKLVEDKKLVISQELKVDAEKLLVDKQALDVEKDTEVKGKQKELLGSQKLKTDEEKKLVTAQELKVDSEREILESQKTQLDAQTAIEATAEKDFYDGVVANTQDTYRDFAAEMRMMGVQEVIFQQTPAYKKIELIKDATKLRAATATETTVNGYSDGEDFFGLREVNKVMRLIGEPPVSAYNSNSLASECIRLIRDTDHELQGRGWWFNTFKDVELVPSSNGILDLTYDPNATSPNNSQMGKVLSAEVYGVPTFLQRAQDWLYNKDKQSFYEWSSPVKATLIVQQAISTVPDKYLEYLRVRVAILLTELYPQSGVDIQRLPKMEAELRAYFKDRDFDAANYTMFDNYDTASILGVNRPITLI
jgi:hypothetical protein